ncbi:putative ORFan [Cotonvirus japonicus]|uniref:ORFan n=1 Tax=Cotonvirus japonicus TaxID=2811091 RepID=A0ABM7NRY0_9VIRU|nr:putative ORFan [Cotonvirus japonicus]BCS82901.1 putative ORFan [Cotonvirus japonicus]
MYIDNKSFNNVVFKVYRSYLLNSLLYMISIILGTLFIYSIYGEQKLHVHIITTNQIIVNIMILTFFLMSFMFKKYIFSSLLGFFSGVIYWIFFEDPPCIITQVFFITFMNFIIPCFIYDVFRGKNYKILFILNILSVVITTITLHYYFNYVYMFTELIIIYCISSLIYFVCLLDIYFIYFHLNNTNINW